MRIREDDYIVHQLERLGLFVNFPRTRMKTSRLTMISLLTSFNLLLYMPKNCRASADAWGLYRRLACTNVLREDAASLMWDLECPLLDSLTLKNDLGPGTRIPNQATNPGVTGIDLQTGDIASHA